MIFESTMMTWLIGSPQAALAATNGTGATISMAFSQAVINRIILQEDLALGQLVMGFTVSVSAPGLDDDARNVSFVPNTYTY